MESNKPPALTFNARSEEVASKPMWRLAYRNSRCLMPAEGWYEWQAVEQVDTKTGEIKTVKQPHFIHRPDEPVFAFAGLMSRNTCRLALNANYCTTSNSSRTLNIRKS